MHWSDAGIVLSVRKHGETSAICTLLTRGHGRHAGLVRGGAGRRLRGTLQAGNEVTAEWRARLADHLGTFVVEPMRSHAAAFLDDPDRLAGLAAACAVADAALPEREPHPALYEAFRSLLDAFEQSDVWPAVFVRWELGLLQELGFGLDLTRCAVTGAADELAYVSPRTGRAVSRIAAGPYKDRLLKLPSFLLGAQAGALRPSDIRDGLTLTGFFLERQVFHLKEAQEPAARRRLVERFSRYNTTSCGMMD